MPDENYKRQAIVLAVLFGVLLLILWNETAQGEAKPETPCAVQSAPQSEPQPVYRITVTSPFQSDQIEYRKELWELIRQTFADEEKGVFDQKKYARIKALAKKLKNPASKPLPSDITRYRPR